MEHTVRMVVIPEEVYLSLVNQNKKLSNPLDAYIIESSNRLNKILHDPNLNDSTKFQLYTNELKKIQKVRLNRDEIPMNVNIKNMEPRTIEDLSNAISEKIPKVVDDEKNTTYSTESGENASFESAATSTPKKLKTLVKSPKSERKKNFELLHNYLNQNKYKFGIREDGRIFKDESKKGVFAYSNFETIAKALTGLTPKRPHGLQRILNTIQNDDYAKNLILNFTESSQKGKGLLKKSITVKNKRIKRSNFNKCQKKKIKKVNFCPEIWS